jgi:hypothetical protein
MGGGVAGSLLGLNGGAGGTGFGTTNPVDAGMLQGANAGTQNTLQQQQALLQALQGQKGLLNQNQVYGQLQDIAAGKGPNPAQAMLNQATGQNIAAQGAMMGGQRGAGSNVGLMARQAAQQGGALQQQAVGQGATMQAQQSLGALGQAGAMANTQAGNQIGQTNANAQANQAYQASLLNANQGYNAIQGGLANTTLQGQQAGIGGLASGLAGGLFQGKAEGGEIKMAEGGDASAFSGPQSRFGQFVNGVGAGSPMQSGGGSQSLNKGMSGLGGGLGNLIGGGSGGFAPGAGLMTSEGSIMAGGAGDAALVSELAPVAMMAARGGSVGSKLKAGGHVPGKPAIPGPVNDYANDTVSAKLSPGEIVIPRSVTMGKDPVKGSAQFVASIIAKRKGRI